MHHSLLSIAFGLFIVATWSGCATKAPTAPVAGLGDWTVDGRDLSWMSEVPARGMVRYGLAPDALYTVAYPPSAGRRDREFRTQHQVPLLSVESGRMVYFQLGAEFIGLPQSVAWAALDSFVATVGPVENQLRSTMIHVGWGDSHLIEFPGGKHMLIDAGESDAGAGVLEVLAARGVPSLDAVLATHVHADHIAGFVGPGNQGGVLTGIPVAAYLDSPSKSHDRSWYTNGVLPLLVSEEIPLIIIERGDSHLTEPALSLDPSVGIHVLNSGILPDFPAKSYEGDNLNNDSIVLRFTYGDVDFIIGGDAEVEAEASMLAAARRGEFSLESEYYKGHHHGRHDGSSGDWLSAVNPRISLFPVSGKEYSEGWPGFFDESTSIIERVEFAGGDVYTIDHLPMLGIQQALPSYNLSFVTDGRSYELQAAIALQTAGRRVLSLATDCDHD